MCVQICSADYILVFGEVRVALDGPFALADSAGDTPRPPLAARRIPDTYGQTMPSQVQVHISAISQLKL